MAKILGIHVPAQLKNLAINGALDFWQEIAGTTKTINTVTASGYSADMFAFQAGGSTNHNFSFARSTDVPSLAQSGFQSTYSNLFTMLTGIASPAAGDYSEPFMYLMEGLDYEKIHSKTVTFGFWFKASVAGTYSFALKNASLNRSYVTTFSGTNTWEFKTITAPLDSTGTWGFDSTIGLRVHIASITGTTYQTSTLNQWQSGNFVQANTATNYQATTNATIRIAQFSIVEGPLGFGATGFARAGDDIQAELAMCQRYYWARTNLRSYFIRYSGTSPFLTVQNPVTMRAVPVAAYSNLVTLSVDAGTINALVDYSTHTVDHVYVQVNTSNTAISGAVQFDIKVDARL